MKTFTLEFVTPEKVALRDQVESVVVPAFDGELGVLAGHAPLLAKLKPGMVRVTRGTRESGSGETTVFAIAGGFLEVRPDRTAIFAEAAETAAEVDAERARQSLERAKAVLAAQPSDADLAVARAAIYRALARLRVAEKIRRRS